MITIAGQAIDLVKPGVGLAHRVELRMPEGTLMTHKHTQTHTNTHKHTNTQTQKAM